MVNKKKRFFAFGNRLVLATSRKEAIEKNRKFNAKFKKKLVKKIKKVLTKPKPFNPFEGLDF